MIPRDLQQIVSKTYFVEKIVDVQNKAPENAQSLLAQQEKLESEKRDNSVAGTEESRGKNIDPKEKKRREEEQKKKQERKKEIAKRLSRDAGHIIDLEV